jgi:4-amino-4-deoxy-L-arabinose transferase-like glycosyltransferase
VTSAVWWIVALVFVLRAVAAFALPMTGDEAYYWEWSKRLAFGYADHPPGVAWTIAAFAWLGQSPGAVRLGFVLCGVVASLALAACAIEISGDRRAGAIAALAMALTPLASLAFGTATPDGPYLMFWSLALWFGARAFARDELFMWLLLGLALGGVLLSRVLGVALLFGVVAYALAPARRAVWRRGMPLALGVCALVCVPWLIWNAQHGWYTLTFALLHRHDERRQFALPGVLAAQAIAYTPGIWIAVLLCAARPRNAFLAWTALPQFALVMLLSLFEQVETYWIFGFFASFCVMLGLAYVALAPRAARIWLVVTTLPAAILLALLFAATIVPGPLYALAERAGLHLRNSGPFEIMSYAPLAAEAKALAASRNAIVMTDGYGLSSVIDFDAGVTPVVIGYDWQGRESRAWYPDGMHPSSALFVDKEPLSTRPDFAAHLARACAHVRDGGIHSYGYADLPPRSYYFTWCDAPVSDALPILRWERE